MCNQEILAELAKKPGILVDDISIYDTFYETRDLLDRKKEFETGSIDCAVFTSASTVRGFREATPGLDYTKVRAACIGRQTQAEAADLGMETYMAREASIDSLLTLVIQLKGKTARK
ncbi:MAG: uroporphyrinogen-III synthase [Blautia hansenii]